MFEHIMQNQILSQQLISNNKQMGKTKLQEFVLSFVDKKSHLSSIIIKVANLDQVRQVIEQMNSINMCSNYNGWINHEGMHRFSKSESDHLIINIKNKSVTYNVLKKIVDIIEDNYLAIIDGSCYLIKRQKKKLII